MRTCDICGRAEAVRLDRIKENNIFTEYAYCDRCYSSALSQGILPYELAKRRIAMRGKVCDSCGTDEKQFNSSFMFGCPDCYRYMREIASKAAKEYVMRSVGEETLSVASLDSDLINISKNVVSSRIRLARNVEGMRFGIDEPAQQLVDLFNGALSASEGVFDGELYIMNRLNKVTKKALVARHVISLPLANNELGAVIMEKGDDSQISVMLNEEDHIREQCVIAGLSLKKAYGRLKEYDAKLARRLPIAYDKEFGYLTACPSNLGTGMRASVMLFLPALRRTGAIDNALRLYKQRYGLTVRGYFGEGSEGAYDMYQVSNTVTAFRSEQSIISEVESAAIDICRLEGEALIRLVRQEGEKFLDSISRSYGILKTAHCLSSEELMRSLVDVKLCVILGLVKNIQMQTLNRLIDECASSFEILTDGISEEQRNIERARIVRKCLAEG